MGSQQDHLLQTLMRFLLCFGGEELCSLNCALGFKLILIIWTSQHSYVDILSQDALKILPFSMLLLLLVNKKKPEGIEIGL